MSMKVKRGLGLLVVAAIGYLIAFAAQGDDDMAGNVVTSTLEGVGWLLAAVGLFGGLGLLAWGLLRD